jgi:prepilin peptidase CpaA
MVQAMFPSASITLGPPLGLMLAIFPAGVIAAALKDATSFTIPNWISAALVVIFFPVALVLRLPGEAMIACAASAAAALVCGMGLFSLGWCGGGDAKLMAACALWLGWPAALTFLLATGVAGGALAAGLMTARKGVVGALMASGPGWIGRLFQPDGDLPYGLAICVGALAAFPGSPLVASLGRI